MKSILAIIAFILLFSLHNFSQNKNHLKVLPNRFTTENNYEIYKTNPDSIEAFNAKDSRTIINKTQLENGFLLIDYIRQSWNGSAWVNESKDSYTYDGSNKLTEKLYHSWGDSSWDKSEMYSFTYNESLNLTVELKQYWNGFTWINRHKYSFIYDENNNQIEKLFKRFWNDSALGK